MLGILKAIYPLLWTLLLVALLTIVIFTNTTTESLKTIASASDRWDSTPQRSTMAFTLTRIISAILLQQKFQSTLHETYG